MIEEEGLSVRPSRPADRPDLTRLSVWMNKETTEALGKLMDESGTSATELVRRAIGVYVFLLKAQRKGKTIQLLSRRRKTVQELILD